MTHKRSPFVAIPAIGLGLALFGAAGCSDETFTVRGQLVSLDGLPAAGVPLRADWHFNDNHVVLAELETDADGGFEYEVPVRKNDATHAHALRFDWAADNTSLVSDLVFPDRVYDGDLIALPDFAVWRLDLVATPDDGGVALSWNPAPPPATARTTVDAWAGGRVLRADGPEGETYVPSWLLEDFGGAASIVADVVDGDRHADLTRLRMPSVELPAFEISDARGAACASYRQLIDGSWHEEPLEGCPLTDGDPSSSVTGAGDGGATIDNLGVVIDLGEAMLIARIVVRAAYENPEPATLLLAGGDLRFEEVGALAGPTSAVELARPRRARYVRVRGANQVAVAEVSVFSAGTAGRQGDQR
ncbi:MAG TPA: hypothetical protein VML75_23180 [Kofleriaceae bacterium]|nr:hypothetical protein [Kofleriaceae bacterium]